ncbi:unnamed protein product [Caenorhabditis angaria]|uniref:Uncharacterized protein n=1 Tax=Caenorhabditis angaria TaxID=860376 RepID=A0A9P1J301_9PELO|nr:unnamed protein product [Caenorhabditis angaria]
MALRLVVHELQLFMTREQKRKIEEFETLQNRIEPEFEATIYKPMVGIFTDHEHTDKEIGEKIRSMDEMTAKNELELVIDEINELLNHLDTLFHQLRQFISTNNLDLQPIH